MKGLASWFSLNDTGTSATRQQFLIAGALTPASLQSTAKHLLADLHFYEDLLQRYGVEYHVLTSDDPGTLLYEDHVQIVVAPRLS